MYNVDVLDSAELDLDRIIAYISEKLAAPKAASDFADAVYDCYDNLETNPYMYEQCRDPKLQLEGYRRAVIMNYILVYKIHEDKNLVNVHRFFHGTQDYAQMI